VSQFTNRNSAQRQRDRDTIARTKAGCHICGQPIDYSLRSPDPQSFEVDHLVPLSSARDDAERDLLDRLANKAASHRICNSKKRARAYAPIVKRSGTLG
jgi:5-methylcytosine-specific restriction endonuclease McrA